MGRHRSAENRRLGQYVQRRADGKLELRFPIPTDLQGAFLNRNGRPRQVYITSLGTADVNLGNAKAEQIKVTLRKEFESCRSRRSPEYLNEYLKDIFEYEKAHFKSVLEVQRPQRVREMFSENSGIKLSEIGLMQRKAFGAALASEDVDERRAVAGWAADQYFERRGEIRDPTSKEYNVVLEECARVLIDGVLAKNALEEGKPEPQPLSKMLSDAVAHHADLDRALASEGRLKISDFFKTEYERIETGPTGLIRGERNISGKRHSIRLFAELVGDLPVCKITKRDLFKFLDELSYYPDSRLLVGPLKNAKASDIVSQMKQEKIKLKSLSPKTANKHITNISAILKFAERRGYIEGVNIGDVKAVVVGGDKGAGRAFTTAELNRLFSLPLFTGCAGEDVEGGLFKPGDVLIRDDRFWIPLVLLFTGARSSEIVGIMTKEVFIDHEIPHFLIQENTVRPSLKNQHSRRMVPIHARLLSMGFKDFVRARIEAGDERLFPMAEKTSYREGDTGEKVSRSLSSSLIMRQFNRTILDHAVARTDRGSIKCFRNTFEQEAASKIISDDVRQRLTGRKVVSTSRIYTENIPYDPHKRTAQLKRLKKDIDCITYDSVMLDHLHKS